MASDHTEKYLALVIRTTPEDCWQWGGTTSSTGYGSIECAQDGRRVVKLAHRVSYELAKGPIPPGLDVMHLCHNPRCTNPAHLEAGTRRQNMQTSQAAGRLQRKIPLGDMPRIRARRLAGETLQAIANGYGCSKQAVRHMLRSA